MSAGALTLEFTKSGVEIEGDATLTAGLANAEPFQFVAAGGYAMTAVR